MKIDSASYIKILGHDLFHQQSRSKILTITHMYGTALFTIKIVVINLKFCGVRIKKLLFQAMI